VPADWANRPCSNASSPSGLLKLVLRQLGEVPRLGKDKLFSQILDQARQAKGTLLLIFDEAHLLGHDALVDLRLLVSSAVEAGPPLKILLVGQEHLRQTLKRCEYADIVNRVSVRYQLRPLTKDQTRRYIDHQMSQHGGDVKTFDDGVKDLIYEFTAGNPRAINNAAIACLLHATSKRIVRIDEETFRQASSELLWN
jgi:general secretion pathway protein A